MTAIEFCNALNRMGITQAEASRQMNVDRTTVRRWQRGERPVEGPAEVLVEVFLENPRVLAKRIGRKKK